MPVTQPELFLTFDDGPVPGPTEFVLDTLHAFTAKATFFCIGDNIQKHPEVFERVVHAGHQIGNHTFNHLNGWRTDDNEYYHNIEKCEQVIGDSHAQLQQNRPLFRPPYGRITRRQISLVRDFRIIMWDVLTRDYDARIPSGKCLRKSVKATRPGSIVVFHDSLKAEKNLRYVLPRFLEVFALKGYAFKTL